MSLEREVVVVTGVGGIGEAVSRRLASGRSLVLADLSRDALARVAGGLRALGHEVVEVPTDVTRTSDVEALAKAAAGLGSLRCLVHTAGLSSVQGETERVLDVDLVGTARVLDAFLPYANPGTVAVCIASMAGHVERFEPEVDVAIATTPTESLARVPALDPKAMPSTRAYIVAKRGVQLRVQAASIAWGRRGARVVSISPGIISTPMTREELAGPSGDLMRGMLERSAAKRLGTPEDIAALVEFLASPAASFITGTDILIDGGTTAAIRFGGR